MRLSVREVTRPLAGELVVPDSKYHAHRALILASLAEGSSTVLGLSDAGHVRHTIQALRQLGTGIEVHGDSFVVHGGQYHPRRQEISVGSSGTTLYFLTGLASLAAAPVTITGQRYFQRRPIRPLLEALRGLGVDLESATGCPPIAVTPRRPRGGRVRIQGTLSQWISGLLLLAPFASGPSRIEIEGELNERSYIDLTIRMMRQFGLEVQEAADGRSFEIAPDQQARPATVRLPPDVGAAAFGLAITALHPSDVSFRGLSALSASETDHPEAELLDIVRRMGLPTVRDAGTGMVRVCHQGLVLEPVEVDCRAVPDMLPILAVLGTFANGTTVLENVAHVRLKESDRVSAMLQLNRMGGRVELDHDRLLVRGVKRLRRAELSSFNDHRVLMALAVAASRARGESRLTYPHAYRISYPRFLLEMNHIGVSMSVAAPTEGRAGRRAPSRLSPAAAAATPVDRLVRRWASERPSDLAVIDGGEEGKEERVWSWEELDRETDRVASLLLGLGVALGEPVAFQLPNCAEFVLLALALARIGAVSCPLMPIFREREMGFMLFRSRARVLVVLDHFRGRDCVQEVKGLMAGSGGELVALEHVLVVGAPGGLPGADPEGAGPSWHHFQTEVERQSPDRAVLERRRPEARSLAQLLFTSGTSGEPKGVLHRMDVLTRAAAMEVRHLSLGSEDRIFIPSPLAHQTGFLYGMWLAFVLGVPQILQRTWEGTRALDLLRRFGGTFVQAATPFLGDLVRAVEVRGERPGKLRIFVATGAAVPRALAERATRTLGAAVCGAWGTTETCLGTLAAPEDEPARTWGTDGRALAGVRIRVTDDEGRVLAPGLEGNFEVSSPCLFEGYLDRPDLTQEVLTEDGFYRSGDLAVIDEAGYVRISGRLKDVINRGGEKVPVAEIEQLLHQHPEVADVAIVAMPDERLGERACAFVVSPEGLRLEEACRFLDDHHVAKQYWPERLELVESLPRNPAGKVQKFLLREWAARLVEAAS
ncbi:MAG: 3-phosphoshikimate 1-carboxyvinyltransferase [Candidatus Dormibacteria bacterium]